MNHLRTAIKRAQDQRISRKTHAQAEEADGLSVANPTSPADDHEQWQASRSSPHIAETALATDAIPLSNPNSPGAATVDPIESYSDISSQQPKDNDATVKTVGLVRSSSVRKLPQELPYSAQPHLELPEDLMFPYEDADPCSSCNKLTLEKLQKGGFKQNWTEMSNRADEGCKLCGLFRDALLSSEGGPERILQAMSSGGSVLVSTSPTTGSVLVRLFQDKDNVAHRMIAIYHIGLYTDIGDPAANFIPTRRLSIKPHLERMVLEIKKWLKSRDADTEASQKLPKRVIDVLSSPDSSVVNLKEVDPNLNGSEGRYICLSHRWSQLTQPLTTTMESLPSRKQGIRLLDLSQTFQDIIEITKRLEVRYLWIDSLCILQDSRDDWEDESNKMGQYYKSSWLTIGAGMDGDGLYLGRTTPSRPYLKLVVPTVDPLQPLSNLYFLQDPHTRPVRDIFAPNQSPLYSRGWTLQEEILSPRFLSFEPTQVYFRCSKHIDYECGHRESVNRWNALTAQFHPDDINSKALWIRIVENYSSRTLKVPTDKLPALSGLAQVYQNSWNDTYLAGLWKNELWTHLIWYGNMLKRPPEYLGPSWSWVSTNSVIAFAGHRFAQPCMTLVGATVNILGKNPLGRVDAGSITIHAPVTQLIVRTTLSGESRDPREHNIKLFTSVGERCSYHPDEPLPDDQDAITFVHIASTMGLTLLPIQGWTDTYRRVGFAFVPGLSRTAAPAVVTII